MSAREQFPVWSQGFPDELTMASADYDAAMDRIDALEAENAELRRNLEMLSLVEVADEGAIEMQAAEIRRLRRLRGIA